MKLNENQKKLIKTIVGAVIYALAIFTREKGSTLSLAAFLVAYVIIGGDVLWRAVRNILRGKVFDENFLMSLATIGAFIVGDFAEAVAVMLFYQVGELFQDYAVDQSRDSIAALMNIRPDYANVQRGDMLEKVDPDEVKIDETIVIKPGERVPLDAVVLSGSSSIDTSALTGESLPRDVDAGDALAVAICHLNNRRLNALTGVKRP